MGLNTNKPMALRELNIRNFAIIKQLEIELNDGLTVISGETGAGKSIVLGALNLLLGARAEANMIRHGEDQCEITALFEITHLPDVSSWLQDRDLLSSVSDTLEAHTERGAQTSYCLVRRVIRIDKPTKCYINDQPTTLASLKELGAHLVDLHGQHEHQSLLRRSTQRQIIDQFANHASSLSQMARHAAKIHRLQRQLATVTGSNADTSDRLELLAFQINELEEAQLVADEYQEIEDKQKRLANTELLKSGLEQALDRLYHNDEQNISTSLGNIINNLQVLSEVDSGLVPPLEQLNTALTQLDDSKTLLETSLNRIEADPEHLQELEQRLDLLVTLARKHRCSESELVDKLTSLQSEYSRLEQLQTAPDDLKAEIEAEQHLYQQLSNTVSKRRQAVAVKLSQQITEQMQDLGMRGGQLVISVTPQNSDELLVSEHGLDLIEYQVSTNHGLPFKPLIKTASGGELSRISLAIQVITSQHAHTPCLVFDEVDVGVGGKVAGIVGERLKKLGQHAQVICITHLPQVASQGDHHFAVDKVSSSYDTYSTLLELNSSQRVEEIARMLGGTEVTEQTRAHAAEMLANSATLPAKAAS